MLRLKMMILAVTVLVSAADAQTTVDWNSQPLELVVSAKQANEYFDFDQLTDTQLLMLYNRKTGKFLTTGAEYGTRAVLGDQGYPVYVTRSGSMTDKYLLWSQSVASRPGNGQAIGFYQTGKGIFFDRPGDQGANWAITLKRQENNHYFYQLVATPVDLTQTRYVTATTDGKVIDGTDGDSEYTLWEFVTKADVMAEIEKRFTVADGANLVDVSLLLFNPNFIKNNRYGMYWQTNNANPASIIDYGKWTWSGARADFEVGIGKKTDVDQYGVTNYYWTEPYAKYQTAQISGNGTLAQRVTITKSGWYRMSAEGWEQNIHAQFFVYTSLDGVQTTPLQVEFSDSKSQWQWVENDGVGRGLTNSYEWYPIIIGETFSNNDAYKVAKDIYIPAGAQLVFGVEATDRGNEGIAIFDNFKLEYIGRSYLYLDEDATDIQYMKAEADDNDNAYNAYSRLYLYRTLNRNAWNGIVLPVSLTARQLKSAFGDDVKLAVCKGTTDVETMVAFETVDLSSNTNVALQAYELYLIKPVSDSVNTTPTSYVNKQGTTIKVSAPYYIIDDMAIDATYLNTVNAEKLTTGTYGTQQGRGVSFFGTLVKKVNGLDAGNYVFTKDGNLTKLSTPRSIYGFRCWLEDRMAAPSGAKSFSELISIDGNGVTEIQAVGNTAIERASDRVYNLSGQHVGTFGQMNALGKGIYVVNGKKYIVK